MKEYCIKYGGWLFFLLFIVPIGFYGMLSYLDAIGAKPLFPSLAVWCGFIIAAWLLALFFMFLIDQWDNKGDHALDEWGISQSHKIEIIWSFVTIPSFLGALIFGCTLIDRPPVEQAFTFHRILALFLGFVPVGLYGFFRAKQLTKHIMEKGELRSMARLPRYLRVKWLYLLIIGITLFMTPFFGAAVVTGNLRRYVPKTRKLVVPAILLLGFLVGIIFLPPLIQQMRGPVPQGWWLYFTINLFAGVTYVLIWKSVFLSNLYQQHG